MTYFAKSERSDIGKELINKINNFFQNSSNKSYFSKLERMWKFYHGIFDKGSTGHEITFLGDQGEIVSLNINHFANLAQYMHTMITSNRPTLEARAINTEYKSLAQTYLARDILDYYMREKGLEDVLIKAVEIAIVLGSGYVKLGWNATAGEKYDVDPVTGKILYDGEMEFSNLTPFDVIFDDTKESWDMDWVIVKTYKNKYDLAEKFSNLKEKILSIPTKNKILNFNKNNSSQTDDVIVYEFFHKRSESMENGRYVMFLDEDTVLIDTGMPYRRIPVFRIAAREIMGTAYGYSPMFDVYPIQEAINVISSNIMTNINAFGVQNLFVPKSADLNVKSLEGNLNIIEANEQPVPLNLLQTPPEMFGMLNILVQSAETISGINSVTRGNPEASLKSGTALALVQSMSIQFISGLQKNYIRLIEETGTSLIEILKDFAHTPRIYSIVGRNNRTYLKQFVGEDLNAVNRVIVTMGNALSKSLGGRLEIANQLLQMGLLKTPQQYIQIVNTGNLDIAYEGETAELLTIKLENEKMSEGILVPAIFTDDHLTHIKEHKSVLADPELRINNPQVVEAVTNHIQQHIDLLRTIDPALLALLGQQPLGPETGTPPRTIQNESLNPDSSLAEITQPPINPETTSEAFVLPDGSKIKFPNLPNT